MGIVIDPRLELVEILNAFPVLEEMLKKSNFNLSDIEDGVTFYDYFAQKNMSDDEIYLLIKKLNNDIKCFLKKGKLPKMNLQKESEVLMTNEYGLEMISSEEEE